jgi:hypothetical protein
VHSNGRAARHAISRIWFASILIVVAIGAIGAWAILRPAPNQDDSHNPARVDPRLAYSGPFRNVRPEVHEVGSARCAVCHPGFAEKFSHHPMGRSLARTAEVAAAQDYSPGAHNPFSSLGSRFSIDRVGDVVHHKETRTAEGGAPIYELSLRVDYVMGSGAKGYSYLTDSDGFVFQTPISWYAQKGFWDISPGFTGTLHAGRAVSAECFYCHANHVEPIAGTLNRFAAPLFTGELSIGCERCHGPGEEHVRMREAGENPPLPDYSIVNPKHLKKNQPTLHEAICQQCHLEGEGRILRVGRELYDFRPGMALEDCWSVLVEAHDGEDRKAVNHVEQMYLSRCFQKSAGKLGCTSCHDPHEKPASDKRIAYYRAKCVECHDCSTPLAQRSIAGVDNNCIVCHMPRFESEDISHAATTDHRIVRWPTRSTQPPAAGSGPPSSGKPWVFFPRRPLDPQDAEQARDYALGLFRGVGMGRASVEVARTELPPLLERALQAFPTDPDLLMAKAFGLQMRGRRVEALAAAEALLAVSPRHEFGLSIAGNLAQTMQDSRRAVDYWQRAVEVNPWMADYRSKLALNLMHEGRTEEGAQQVEACLRLDPANTDARKLRVDLLLRAGRKNEADTEFRKLESLNPPQIGEWRNWYAARRRSP